MGYCNLCKNKSFNSGIGMNSELLAEIQKLVVKAGHEVAKNPDHPCEAGVILLLWKPMSITDLNLLWERCMRNRRGSSTRLGRLSQHSEDP